VNEKARLEREQVARPFAETQGGGAGRRLGLAATAAIGRFLEKHGRSGVPLYLYYEPGKPVRNPAAGADALAAFVDA
jgi:hypothetical protein